MSDPVSNAEIEDVLSSIRRLVSTADRSDEGTTDAQETQTDTTDTERRLVLTPSLRVDHTDDDEAAEEAGESDPAGTDVLVAEEVWQFRHNAHDEDAPDDGDESGHDDDTSQRADDEVSADPDQLAEVGDDITQDDAVADTDDEPASAALEDRIAEVEAAVAARDDQWEPDGDSGDEYSGSAVSPMAWEDYAPEPAEEEDDSDSEPSEEAEAEATAEPEVTGPEEPQDDSEPERPDHAEDDMVSRAAQDDDTPLWQDERADAYLDEEALRDMVSEIVRQELQGALGERITRNVRKLVRREIHRALSSHELD
ncbi:hypothetical protein KPG71_02525 [Roseovarius sp. PS-C2]|uniref:hypothetical protein n=1 Tax=Roseovarius sp. PS-C2 TaxID=2820814 RepID=UPI001C0BF683|nr:hypothetical protein [Roseovarius sp. PS-C2]MBU3258884.1 hypothetical protein [Roseovarius sp. PS-C2]